MIPEAGVALRCVRNRERMICQATEADGTAAENVGGNRLKSPPSVVGKASPDMLDALKWVLTWSSAKGRIWKVRWSGSSRSAGKIREGRGPNGGTAITRNRVRCVESGSGCVR